MKLNWETMQKSWLNLDFLHKSVKNSLQHSSIVLRFKAGKLDLTN